MRQHKLALCREHYLEWFPQQAQRFIEKYRMFGPQDRILVAVSGGKDSLALWDVLSRLGYQAEGLYIGLGIDGGLRTFHSHQMVAQFAVAQAQTHTVDVRPGGATIPVAASLTHRGRSKPCSVCGLSKRHIMNKAALDGGFDVLATGHNLDDEAAVLFGNTLNWSVGYLARQGPVLEAGDGLVRKVKPFCRLYERETAAYTLLRGIEYIYDECPYATGATRSTRMLNKWRRRPASSPFTCRSCGPRKRGSSRPRRTGRRSCSTPAPPAASRLPPPVSAPTAAPGARFGNEWT
jgi:tRNA(Ile)-lysidine synthase TilS/MesJ